MDIFDIIIIAAIAAVISTILALGVSVVALVIATTARLEVKYLGPPSQPGMMVPQDPFFPDIGLEAYDEPVEPPNPREEKAVQKQMHQLEDDDLTYEIEDDEAERIFRM